MAFSLRNNFLTNVYSKVVELLDQRSIRVSSVDFVRFTWLNKMVDREIEEEEEEEQKEYLTYDDIPFIQPVEYGERHYTNPTIWIGVVPGTLTGATAQKSSKDIRAFLDSLQVQNIDIAYRESVYRTWPSLSSSFPPH